VEKKFLNTTEAAELLGGISPDTLRTWRSRGKGPRYLRVAGSIRYRRKDIERFRDRDIVFTNDDPGE